MGKLKTDKGRVIDDAFRREAVRLLVTSGRTLNEVADDLDCPRFSGEPFAVPSVSYTHLRAHET